MVGGFVSPQGELQKPAVEDLPDEPDEYDHEEGGESEKEPRAVPRGRGGRGRGRGRGRLRRGGRGGAKKAKKKKKPKSRKEKREDDKSTELLDEPRQPPVPPPAGAPPAGAPPVPPPAGKTAKRKAEKKSKAIDMPTANQVDIRPRAGHGDEWTLLLLSSGSDKAQVKTHESIHRHAFHPPPFNRSI